MLGPPTAIRGWGVTGARGIDFYILWTRSIVVQFGLLWDRGAASSTGWSAGNLSAILTSGALPRLNRGSRFKLALVHITGLIASISTGDTSTES